MLNLKQCGTKLTLVLQFQLSPMLLQVLLQLLLHQSLLLPLQKQLPPPPLPQLSSPKKFLMAPPKLLKQMTSPHNGKTLNSKETLLSKLSTFSFSSSLLLSDFCTLISKLMKRRKLRKKEKPEQKELSMEMLINHLSLISLLVKWTTHTTPSTHTPEPASTALKSKLKLTATKGKRSKCLTSEVPGI